MIIEKGVGKSYEYKRRDTLTVSQGSYNPSKKNSVTKLHRAHCGSAKWERCWKNVLEIRVKEVLISPQFRRDTLAKYRSFRKIERLVTLGNLTQGNPHVHNSLHEGQG